MMKRFLSIALLTGATALGMQSLQKPVDIGDVTIDTPRQLIHFYNRLSEESKEALRSEVQSLPSVYCPDCGEKHEHPLLDPKYLKLAVGHARQILAKYPHDRIFGLGQSPAYIIETAKILQELGGQNSDTIRSFVAFSGNYLKLCRRKNLPICYTQRKHAPSRKQILAYRDYLISIGLDPATIVKEFKKGNRTVMVDFADTGEGLASFIRMLTNWAKELRLNQQLREALYTEIFVTKELSSEEPTLDMQKTLNVLFPNPTKHLVNEDFMSDLADSDMFDDRLAMHYPFRDWGKEFGPQTFRPSRSAQLLRFFIVDQLVVNKGDPKKFKYSKSFDTVATYSGLSETMTEVESLSSDSPHADFWQVTPPPKIKPQLIEKPMPMITRFGTLSASEVRNK